MVTLAGTLTAPLLLLRSTEVAFTAALSSDTVQVLLALLTNVDGAQERDERAGACVGPEMEIIPEPPLERIGLPPAVAATTPTISMGIAWVEGFKAI